VAWHRVSCVQPRKSEEGSGSAVTASRRPPGGAGRRGGTPAEAASALALDMRTVWGDGVGHGWLRQGLERHGLRRPPRFPHRIQALPRPLEQAATPREGAPVQRGTEPVGGGLALLSNSSISSAIVTKRSWRFLSLSSNVRASSVISASRQLFLRLTNNALCC
jgi:hypothetical protein